MPAVTGPRAGGQARIAAGVTIAGIDPAELVAAHGSPLFVYDLDVLTARVAALRAVLPATAEVAFAVKANPSLAVLAHLARLGVGADVASGGELTAAVRAGIPIDRIIFTGPGKTDAELGRALRLGVRAVTVESLEELDVLIELRELAHLRQGLLLRLAVSSGREETPIISGPGAAKFGLTADEVDEALDRLHRAGAAGGPGASFEVLGLHAFGASNVRDADQLIDGVRELAARAESVAARHGTPIRLLDAGGGLGIPYTDDDAPLDLDRFGQGLTAELATWADRRALAGGRLLIEPGRFLVGPIGAYVVRVTRTKPRAGRTIAVVDGGIHHLIRPALIGQGQRIVAVGEAAMRPATAYGRRGRPPVHRAGRAGRRRPGPRTASRRPAGGARHWRLRLQRVDAAVPLASPAGRSGGQRRPGVGGAPAARAGARPGRPDDLRSLTRSSPIVAVAEAQPGRRKRNRPVGIVNRPAIESRTGRP